MGEAGVKLFDSIDNRHGESPDLGVSTLLIIIYISLGFIPLVATLSAYLFKWTSNAGSFVQTIVFSIYLLNLISLIFLFFAGILSASRDTHLYPRHRRLVLYSVLIVIGAIAYPMFISVLSPFTLILAVLISKTNLGIVAQENIFHLGGVMVQFLLINLPIIALGLLLSERRWQRNLLKISILLFLLVVALNFLTWVIFPPTPTIALSFGGFPVYDFLQIELQDILEISAFICIAAVFIKCRRDTKRNRMISS